MPEPRVAKQMGVAGAATAKRCERSRALRRQKTEDTVNALRGRAVIASGGSMSPELARACAVLAGPDGPDTLGAARFVANALAGEVSHADGLCPIGAVLAECPLRRLIDLARPGADGAEALRGEALRVLCAVAASDRPDEVAALTFHGGLDVFAAALRSGVPEVRCTALVGIGNMAGEHVSTRDYLVGSGGLEAMATLCAATDASARPEEARTLVWAMSRISRAGPLQPARGSALMAFLARFLDAPDVATVADATWGMLYVAENDPESAVAVCCAASTGTDVVRRGIELMLAPEARLQVPATRLIASLTFSDPLAERAVDAGVIEIAGRIAVSHPRRTMRRDAAWLLGNLPGTNGAWSERIVRALGGPQGFVELVRAPEPDCARELMLLMSAVCACDHGLVDGLLDAGVGPVLAQWLGACRYDEVTAQSVIAAVAALCRGDRSAAAELESSGVLDGLEEHAGRGNDTAQDVITGFFTRGLSVLLQE